MSEAGHIERLESALAGRYRIERKLGEGGMASVYLGEDLKHGRRVALKVLRPELAAVLGAERFLSEIKTTANLQHPHILPLFDSGNVEGYLYYVMPYIDGETLRAKLDREKQLGVEEAVRIARDVADALDYAHRHGVIHRDIKPGNILLHDGRPVVADFGIALAVSAAGGGRMTETGLSLGTPHYMSPEQASADRDLSRRSDVYSLGCVLYEMLGGQPPHTGPSAQSILVHILTEEPRPLTQLRHTVPANVAAAVAKAIEKLPADRFESARQFRDALEDTAFRYQTAAATSSAVTPGLGPDVSRSATTRWTGLTTAFASLAAVLAIVAGWSLSRPSPPAPVGRFELPLPAGVTSTVVGGVGIAIAEDGSQIVVSASSGGVTTGLWKRSLDQLSMQPIPGTDGALNPVFSPDGDAIAVTLDDRLVRVSLTGMPPLTLVAEGVPAGGLSWSDDGWIYFRRDDGLWRVSEQGGQPEQVSTVRAQNLTHQWPDALPNGKGVVFTMNVGAPREDSVAVLDLETGEYRTLFQGAMARYATSGHLIYTSGEGTLLAVPFDENRLEVTGPARTYLEGVQVNAGSASYFAVSRTGSLLYVEGEGASGLQLAEVALDGTRRLLPIAPRSYSSYGPVWSPDGRTVAFSSDDQIYTYDVVLNSAPRQVTFEGANVAPVFSPDGSKLVFETGLGDIGESSDLFVKDLSSDAPARLLAALEGVERPLAWPADTLIVIQRDEGRNAWSLWLLNVSDPENPQASSYLTSEANLGDAAISPDGELAAYSSDASGESEVYIRSFPEPGERTAVTRGFVPFWAPDGNTLYVATGGGRAVVALRLGRDPVPVVLAVDTLFSGFQVIPSPGATLHPDGDRFIMPVPMSIEGETAPNVGRLVLVQNFFEALTGTAAN